VGFILTAKESYKEFSDRKESQSSLFKKQLGQLDGGFEKRTGYRLNHSVNKYLLRVY
jgi:hypothetical protein